MNEKLEGTRILLDGYKNKLLSIRAYDCIYSDLHPDMYGTIFIETDKELYEIRGCENCHCMNFRVTHKGREE